MGFGAVKAMIHYHGTPIGGTKTDACRFLIGRHALIPFPRRDQLEIAADVCQSFVFDNGAFSVWKSGKVLNFDEYVRWCDDWKRHPSFDWALIPDVIDGSEDENDKLLQEWPKDIRGVPVWHLDESINRLVRLAITYDVVALGSSGKFSSPGSIVWWDRINEALPNIVDSKGRPFCKLHGLRMLNPKVFTRLPLSSADSTNAAVNAGSLSRFGMYIPATNAQRADVVADRIERYQSADRFPGQSAVYEFDE